LAKQLSYYGASPIISTIIVIWHNIAAPPPKHGIIHGTYVRFEVPTSDTLNNRFVPLITVTTECIMVIDDDMKIHFQDLANLFEAWKHNPRNVVGFMPRWVDGVKNRRANSTHNLLYRSQSEDPEMGSFPKKRPHKGYSLILTKALMVHRDYMRLYTCGGESEDLRISISSKFDEMRSTIHRIVDSSLNCEDIGLNFVANAALYSLGKAAPLYVQPLHIMGDFGKVQFGKGGLHQRKSHMGGRDQCLNQINREFAQISKTNLPIQKKFIAASHVDELTTLLTMTRYHDHRKRLHNDCTLLNGHDDGPCSWDVPSFDLAFKAIYKSL
jgi:alpha-1,4-N-acetylglucosaminyltransferase EXTL2